jgi:hypothetical protein
MNSSLREAIDHLGWMREQQIWPNGLRYLWTDAFGLVLLVSLYETLADDCYLIEAESLVAEVDRVLGRPIGIRIGQQPDRDGQYYHYLAMWLFALSRLGRIKPEYRQRGIDLAKAIHPRFVIPGTGVIWKMREDLSGPYPGYGLGALDAFHGLVVYEQLGAGELQHEIRQMQDLVDNSYRQLHVTQDLGLGMLLWMSQFAGQEPWSVAVRVRSLAMLDRMWIDPPGYFCREPFLTDVKFAFTNYGVSIGLQAVRAHAERVQQLNRFFNTYRSHDAYDRDAITHVMRCCSLFPGELLESSS